MTDTVSIAARKGETVATLTAGLAGAFELKQSYAGGVSIARPGERWIILTPNPYAEIEEPDDIPRITEMLGGAPSFFTLTTTNIGLARDVLVALSGRRDLVIDTQHGVLTRLSEFGDRLRQNPGWDWRR